MSRGLPVFVLAVLIAGVAFAGSGKSQVLDHSGKTVTGQDAPWFAAWGTDEKPFNRDHAFRDPNTKRLALVFWATWCAPCLDGLRVLNNSKAELDAAGVRVVLVNATFPTAGQNETKDDVRRFLSRNPTPYTVVFDEFGNNAKLFLNGDKGDNGSLPRTVVIGRDNKVIRIIGREGEDYVRLLTE